MNRLLMASCLSLLLCSYGAASALAHDACTELCKQCGSICSKNLADFQKRGGKYAEASRINLMKDCVKICDTNADFKNRKSSNGTEVDTACAYICRKCAKDCEVLNDPKLKDCIALCNQCADACEKDSK